MCVFERNPGGGEVTGGGIQHSGDCGKEVKRCVQAGWNGWGKAPGVILEKKGCPRMKWEDGGSGG